MRVIYTLSLQIVRSDITQTTASSLCGSVGWLQLKQPILLLLIHNLTDLNWVYLPTPLNKLWIAQQI
jgi:hypothetical protein